ncbi:MAG: hypothetical protein OXI43_09800 [Candidatus Poribacteria bacterium]|nr:hypothetical protein [Candidatus Poribacteria bacterium]
MFNLRNASILALIVLFSTICLFPMDLSADHDNWFVHGLSAQTMARADYYHPEVRAGGYGGIWNTSEFVVKYYVTIKASVWLGHGQKRFSIWSPDPQSQKGTLQPGTWWDENDDWWMSFYHTFTYDMEGREGDFTAVGEGKLELTFDLNGNGGFGDEGDDSQTLSSTAELQFEIE